MMHKINWHRLAQAIDYYQSLGFEYVETPWLVHPFSAEITTPRDRRVESLQGYALALAASGEQGFLDLNRQNRLENGVNFVTCSPCFRIQDERHSDFHHAHFMKVELFSRCESKSMAQFAEMELLNRAATFMTEWVKPTVTKQPNEYDLEIAGIEVGSYGHRYDIDTGWWAYGTGLAEPRFSQALLALEK